MSNTQMYLVKNRSASRVIYRIPETNVRREFAPGEVKKISYEELESLTYQPGGSAMMANFLQIQSAEAIQNLGMRTEPEYNMSEQQIIELLQTGSLDAFLDCLDFAPVGVIDLVKKYAVSLPLTDYEKRQALVKKFGFDVDKMIANDRASKEDEKDTAAVRRIQPVVAETTTPGRRTSGGNYKVVTKITNTEAITE